MRYTLLEYVQKIADKLQSDPITELDESDEAVTITNLVETIYFEVVQMQDWPWLEKRIKLEALSDTTRPSTVHVADLVRRLPDCSIRFDVKDFDETEKRIRKVEFLHPEDFTDLVSGRRDNDGNLVEHNTDDGIGLFIRNDKHPHHWTSFDDEHIIFDSWDQSVSNTILIDQAVVRGVVEPTWSNDPNFVPELPDRLTSAFLAELFSRAYVDLKQTENNLDKNAAFSLFSREQSRPNRVRRDEDGAYPGLLDYSRGGSSRGGYR